MSALWAECGQPGWTRRTALGSLIAAGVLLAVAAGCGSSSVTPLTVGTRSREPYDTVVLRARPAAFWNVSAQGSIEPDLSGNGHSGRYEGGMPKPTKLPDGELAADFNGSGEYLRVRSSSQFSIPRTGELTWEAWIRPDRLSFTAVNDPSSSGYVDWMGKCQSHRGACEWGARMYATMNSQGRCNRLSAYVFNPSGGLGSGADWQPDCGLLHAGEWLYVVGEYQTRTTPAGCASAYPGSVSIWVDAVKQNFAEHEPTGCMSQLRVRPAAGPSPLNIGTMALDSWFPGAIAKVAIYDTLLTQKQIAAHYEAMTRLAPTGRCASRCMLG